MNSSNPRTMAQLSALVANQTLDQRIVLKIATLVDRRTLDQLATNSSTSSVVSGLLESQFFWYKRAEVIVKHRLKVRPDADWKSACAKLEVAMQNFRPMTAPDLDGTSTSVLLELGYDPTEGESYAIKNGAHQGKLDVVTVLMRDGRVDQQAFEQALHYAAVRAHVEVARYLLTWTGRLNNALLERALEETRNAGVVSLLLPLIDPNVDLTRYLEHKDYDAVRLLLADPRVDSTQNNNAILDLASSYLDVGLLHALLEDGRADPDAHLFDRAAEIGNIGALELLIEDGRVDINETDAPEIACANGHVDTVKLLLDSGLDMRERSLSCFRNACLAQTGDVMKLLLSDPRVPVPEGLLTMAIDANANANVIRVLLRDRRVDPNEDDSYALEEASANGNLGAVQVLLSDSRVDPRANHDAAIRAAYENGHTAVVNKLRDYGARLE